MPWSEMLNLSAWYPSFSTWDLERRDHANLPGCPCTQVGWGVVNMSTYPPMIEHLNGTQMMPDRPGMWNCACRSTKMPVKPTGAFTLRRRHLTFP